MDNKALKENKLKILSVNCQGLNDFHKRKDVFRNLKIKTTIFISCKIHILVKKMKC